MIEVKGNLWKYPCDHHGISTNGTIKSNGEAVLGRGCALEAKIRFPHLPKELGEQLKFKGNRVHYFAKYTMFTIPVKKQWFEKADLELINQSVLEMHHFATRVFPKDIICIPRLGCGNGGLNWDDVKPIMAILPDNVKVINWR